MTDENEFFRQATLIICGNLEIEAAMGACLPYLGQFLPADRMFLQLNEPSLGAIRTLAMATMEGGRKVDLLTPLGEKGRTYLLKSTGSRSGGIVVIDSEQDNPVAVNMLGFHGIQGSAVLRMPLVTENGQVGGVVLTAQDKGNYTKEHVRLFSQLKDPFTIALANTLKHREVIRLRDRLADDIGSGWHCRC